MKTHVTLLLGAMTALTAMNAVASSHREAPNVTRLPAIDSTDFYAFRSYEAGREDYVTLVANYIPLQDGYGGPNYFAMDPNALYEIHIDNNGDAIEDITFQFRFEQKLGPATGSGEAKKLPIGEGDNRKMVAIPLKNSGQVDTDPSTVNFSEFYSINKIIGDRRTGMAMALTGDNGPIFAKPLDNIGEKSFSDYEDYAGDFVHNVSIPDCGVGRVFVGQRKDPFVVNLGKTFDLVNYTPLDADGSAQDDANDDLADKNVTAIALEVPISCVVANSESPVIGAWTSASQPQARILNPEATFAKPEVNGGAWTQVSRLGMPLVNEVVIGLSDKDTFNASEPKDDGQFADYVTHPTLPALLEALFSVPAPTNIPRADLVAAFLTGFKDVNQVPNGANANLVASEMTRLNTAIPATAAADQNAFGVVAGDLAGFPNGRRPGDDVVDIALRVVMGALCHPIAVDLNEDGTANDNLGICKESDAPVGDQPFSDLAPIDASYVDAEFPYLKAPLAGSLNP
jgi:hypothetical protein